MISIASYTSVAISLMFELQEALRDLNDCMGLGSCTEHIWLRENGYLQLGYNTKRKKVDVSYRDD